METKFLLLDKAEGETPLQRLKRFRAENQAYKKEVLSYVGRLDPLAEGLLLVLVGEENKNREKYLNLDKSYEVDILFGIQTDSGDVLGKIEKTQRFNPFSISGIDPKTFLSSFLGKIAFRYPRYSSKPVKGKSLFQWAREGKINEIDIPEKISHIHQIELLNSFVIHSSEIFSKVKGRINKVEGDFRQEEILDSWRQALHGMTRDFQFLKIWVSCSSGTYMRSLAEAIGNKLGSPALAWAIRRKKIGPFLEVDCQKLV